MFRCLWTYACIVVWGPIQAAAAGSGCARVRCCARMLAGITDTAQHCSVGAIQSGLTCIHRGHCLACESMACGAGSQGLCPGPTHRVRTRGAPMEKVATTCKCRPLHAMSQCEQVSFHLQCHPGVGGASMRGAGLSPQPTGAGCGVLSCIHLLPQVGQLLFHLTTARATTPWGALLGAAHAVLHLGGWRTRCLHRSRVAGRAAEGPCHGMPRHTHHNWVDAGCGASD
jgi:hypothetical protein